MAAQVFALWPLPRARPLSQSERAQLVVELLLAVNVPICRTGAVKGASRPVGLDLPRLMRFMRFMHLVTGAGECQAERGG